MRQQWIQRSNRESRADHEVYEEKCRMVDGIAPKKVTNCYSHDHQHPKSPAPPMKSDEGNRWHRQ